MENAAVDALLMDDRAGRKAAVQCGLLVVGTTGFPGQAAAQVLIELPSVLAWLRQTNARLDPELIDAALVRAQARQKGRQQAAFS